ncbi:hypothetical protein K3888_11220 [Dietzia aurantiaca]|uniref:hypothetical protein n=1 Tax=Dietzia aurantiaca TaxID=983873 RepID=UPI001E57006B|nr:hypothetical protein [Dietzia aurantiaca]MCD2263268.1 hypothetical protein [Dietzia aurantiaca]
MTALFEKVSCIRIGTARTWHLPHIVLAADEKSWELHTRCGQNLTGVEHTQTHAVATCQPCVDADRPANARWENR